MNSLVEVGVASGLLRMTGCYTMPIILKHLHIPHYAQGLQASGLRINIPSFVLLASFVEENKCKIENLKCKITVIVDFEGTYRNS